MPAPTLGPPTSTCRRVSRTIYTASTGPCRCAVYAERGQERGACVRGEVGEVYQVTGQDLPLATHQDDGGRRGGPQERCDVLALLEALRKGATTAPSRNGSGAQPSTYGRVRPGPLPGGPVPMREKPDHHPVQGHRQGQARNHRGASQLVRPGQLQYPWGQD